MTGSSVTTTKSTFWHCTTRIGTTAVNQLFSIINTIGQRQKTNAMETLKAGVPLNMEAILPINKWTVDDVNMVEKTAKKS